MDFCGLVRRHHDDLDRSLIALTDTQLGSGQLSDALSEFRLGLAVHMVAEARALSGLRHLEMTPRDALRPIIGQICHEHADQEATAKAMTRVEPGSPEWQELARKLRREHLEHAAREDYFRGPLELHVSAEERQLLASRLATERLRMLSATAPLEIASHVDAA